MNLMKILDKIFNVYEAGVLFYRQSIVLFAYQAYYFVDSSIIHSFGFISNNFAVFDK